MSSKSALPRIGGHVSAAGGLIHAVIRAKEIGAETIQLFASSPRVWHSTKHDAGAVREFQEALRKYAIDPVFLHASYLINLASPEKVLREKSQESLKLQLELANELQVDGLIFHIGSGKETPKDEAFFVVCEALKRIREGVQGKADLIIENSAGGGQKVGSSIHEVGAIIKNISHEKIKFCFDTAHAYAAGIIEEYTPGNIKKLVADIEKEIGFSRVAALHVNDSKSAFNSKRDLHENIGEGYIGMKGFQNLARVPEFLHAAWILEVPGADGMGPDAKNINILRSLF